MPTLSIIILLSFFLLHDYVYSQDTPHIRKGIWVSTFSEKKVLYSKKNALELIKFCKRENIDDIYLQLFRSGQAYYDSKIIDRAGYEKILQSAGVDTIDFLLKEAKRANIKVFAWINALSLSKNKNADIIKKYGEGVLTKDQYLRPSMRTESINESDKYYLRDDQLFLEPGDLKVVDYILSIINEIIKRYPLMSGIHLDYIRYPYPVPYLPRSSFNKYGLTYGYGEKNAELFRKTKGLDPFTMKDEKDNFLTWDDWKRDRVTELVKRIRDNVKSASKDLLLSCAVIPSLDTAYIAAFQDWSLWLEDGYVDYVVLMNYTKNNRLTKEIVISALAHRGKGKVFIGIGAFLMEDNPELFSSQYKIIEGLAPDGIVFFSYDELTKLRPF